MGFFDSIGGMIGGLFGGGDKEEKSDSGSFGGSGGQGFGFIDDIMGSAANFGLQYLGNEWITKPNARDAWERSKNASALAFDRSYGAYSKRYQTTVQDMIRAGINPIMAASSGFNVGNVPQMSNAQSFMANNPPDFSFTGSAKDIAQASTFDSETKRNIKMAQKLGNDAKLSLQKAVESRANTGKITADERLIKKNIEIADKRIWELKFQIEKTKQEAYKTAESREELQLNIERLKKEIQRITASLAQLKKIAKVYDGPAGQFLTYLKAITSSLVGPAIGAAAGAFK